MRTLPSFSSVSHTPSGELVICAGAGATGLGAGGTAAKADAGAGGGAAGAASCCTGAAGGGGGAAGVSAGATAAVEVAGSVEGGGTGGRAAAGGVAAGAGSAAGGAAGAAGVACGSVLACCEGCLAGRSLSSFFERFAFLVLSYTPGICTVPRSGSTRMVRPPYSKVYCACAAVLASKNAAIAKSFFMTNLLSRRSRFRSFKLRQHHAT